jgi:hypothetical protein
MTTDSSYRQVSPAPTASTASVSRTPAIISLVLGAVVLFTVLAGAMALRDAAPASSHAKAVPAALQAVGTSEAEVSIIPATTAPRRGADGPSAVPASPTPAVACVAPAAGPAVAPPANPPVAATPNLKLSAIMSGPTGEAALINGKLIQVGETIEGARLESIAGQTVQLVFDGKTITIRM